MSCLLVVKVPVPFPCPILSPSPLYLYFYQFPPDTCAALFPLGTGEGIAENAGVLAPLAWAQEESAEGLLATDALPDMLN